MSQRQYREIAQSNNAPKEQRSDDFVLEKSIFSNIFEKDIRRVYIYKKAERLAKAIHLIAPAFADAASLRNRLDEIAVGLIDAAIRSPAAGRTDLSRELLALSSVLSIARTGGMLSPMNAELISREAQNLLQEVAAYEEPRVFLDEAPTIASIVKNMPRENTSESTSLTRTAGYQAPLRKEKKPQPEVKDTGKGQVLEAPKSSSRREAVLSAIRQKGQANIKDISTLFRDVSEKTIQRELVSLTQAGLVVKQGERRWSTYTLA